MNCIFCNKILYSDTPSNGVSRLSRRCKEYHCYICGIFYIFYNYSPNIKWDIALQLFNNGDYYFTIFYYKNGEFYLKLNDYKPLMTSNIDFIDFSTIDSFKESINALILLT